VNENKAAGKCDKGHDKAIEQAQLRALNALKNAASCLTEEEIQEIENWINTMFQSTSTGTIGVGIGVGVGIGIVVLCPECLVFAPILPAASD
jgi:hypothetical protein